MQQPPIAASGYSSQAFNPHYPHTERKTETKTCTDCHLSKDNDNNAIMAQLLAQGTNFVNFVGYNAYVGGDGEISAVTVTEWDEPHNRADRDALLNQALERADRLQADGKAEAAREVWSGIVTLYDADPTAAEFVSEARRRLEGLETAGP